ncbi:hypothetical protein [Piscinibacter terrae]|uniref:Uncharacterized protein n=1 Tax=Piscinibacter terrae TaxID=2496871 RepID=A0A3N7HST1_9BURK|nr:hypothetical protein [Albitalea terrae]RQP25350.1 hypothetical protein DZC73_11035 [Albitalea terrae]
MKKYKTRLTSPRAMAALSGLALATGLASCGGGGGSPLGNPSTIENPPGGGGQKLSFIYYQKCINPIFLAKLTNPSGAVNTCSASGCHDTVTGTGGAFRLVPAATAVDLTNPANTPDVVRTSDMYKNYYSAHGEVVNGSPTNSKLLAKPLLIGSFFHGGGQIFSDANDPNVKLISYWISHPVPTGQDEFSSAANVMFTPPDAATGTCNTQ